MSQVVRETLRGWTLGQSPRHCVVSARVAQRCLRKLGDDAENPTYIFTELRVGYRMPKGEAQGPEES